MKKGLLLVLILGLVASPCVWAADSAQVSVTVTITQSISVSVTPGSYGFGSAQEGQTLETAVDTFTALNDGNSAEDFTITVGDSTNWMAASVAGDEEFIMNYNTGASWDLIDPAAGASLGTSVAPAGSQSFGLQLELPTSTVNGGVEQTIPVTVTAQAS